MTYSQGIMPKESLPNSIIDWINNLLAWFANCPIFLESDPYFCPHHLYIYLFYVLRKFIWLPNSLAVTPGSLQRLKTPVQRSSPPPPGGNNQTTLLYAPSYSGVPKALDLSCSQTFYRKCANPLRALLVSTFISSFSVNETLHWFWEGTCRAFDHLATACPIILGIGSGISIQAISLPTCVMTHVWLIYAEMPLRVSWVKKGTECASLIFPWYCKQNTQYRVWNLNQILFTNNEHLFDESADKGRFWPRRALKMHHKHLKMLHKHLSNGNQFQNKPVCKNKTTKAHWDVWLLHYPKRIS